MSSTRSSYPRIISLITAVLGCVLMSTMLWTVLSEPLLASVFWPNEIHAAVVEAFGGRTMLSVSGQQQIDVEWLSILVRTSAFLMIAGLISTITAFTGTAFTGTAFTGTAFTGTSGRSELNNTASVTDVFLERLEVISFPWLVSAVWLITWFVAPMVLPQDGLGFLFTTTPLWMALILAASLNSLAGTFGRPNSGPVVPGSRPFRRPEFLVVITAAIVWEAVSFWMNERLYAGLLVPHGDSAMYEEHLWNVWHGKGFRSYLDQGLFLGEHIQVIHLLLLPLHMLWPSYLMMELCASMSLAACVIPIYSIAVRHSGSPRAAMWLALAWLLYFPMHYLDIAIDLKTLRPSCYGMPFLFCGIDLAERRKLFGSSVCLLIALSTQEDFALIIGPIGFVLFLTGRVAKTSTDSRAPRGFSKWCLSVFGFSAAYVLLAVLVIIPAFRGGDVVHYSRYFGELGSSPGELVRTVLRNPAEVLAVLASFRTLFYVLVLTLPLGLWPLFRPKILLAGAVTFLMLSLIQLGGEATAAATGAPAATGASAVTAAPEQTVPQLSPTIPYHHFHAPLLPVIFWAAAAALTPAIRSTRAADQRTIKARATGHWQRCFGSASSRARFAFFCALSTAVTGSMMPVGVSFWSRQSLYVPGLRATEFSKVLAQLPPESRVASTDYVHTRLTHFDRSYDYSDYLRAVNNYQPGVPPDTDFIVIDTSHPYSQIRKLSDVRELKIEPEKWEVLPDATNGLFIVLKRRTADVGWQRR